MQIKGVVIPVEEEPYEVEFERGDIDYMQRVVGGRFDVADLGRIKASIWFNDEGLLNGSEANDKATTLLWTGNTAHIGYTILCGDCLVTGMADEDGNTLPVPDRLFERIKAM